MRKNATDWHGPAGRRDHAWLRKKMRPRWVVRIEAEFGRGDSKKKQIPRCTRNDKLVGLFGAEDG